jgi:plastocyanin domain-containing protein
MVKNITTIASCIANVGLVFGVVTASAVAQLPHDMTNMPAATQQTEQFRPIEQPFGIKAAVTVGGLGLIGLELWWFLFSKPTSKQAAVASRIQEVAVTRAPRETTTQ